MTEHIWSQENLAAFVVGGLNAEEVERLQRHAAECPECAKDLATSARIDRGLSSLFANSRPDGMMENRMNQAVRMTAASDALRRRRMWMFLGATAAAWALALMGAGISKGLGDSLRFPGMEAEAESSELAAAIKALNENYSFSGQYNTESSMAGSPATTIDEVTQYSTNEKLDGRTIITAGKIPSNTSKIGLPVNPAQAAERLAEAIRTPGFSLAASPDIGSVVNHNGRPVKVEVSSKSESVKTKEISSKSESVKTKQEKTYDFVMEKKQWSQVFEFLTDKTELPFIGTNIPTGTFNFTPPKDKKFNLGEIIDIINDALLCQPENAKWLLIRRSHSFAVIPADQKPDQSIIRLVSIEDLPNCGRTEMVRVQTQLAGVTAEDVAPVLEKAMSQFGKVLPIAESNTLIMTDTAGSLQQVLDILKVIEKTGGGSRDKENVVGGEAKEVTYPVAGGSADLVVKMLSERYAGTSVRIAKGPGDSAIRVVASREAQKEIEAYTKGLAGEKKTETVTLTNLDATDVATRLKKIFGEKSGAPSIEAMTQTNAIGIHGTEAQIKDVKAAISGLAEIPTDPAARRVIREGEIEFEVDSFDSAVATAQLLVSKIKGAFLATVNSEKLPNGKVKGSLVVRLPPDSLDGFLLDLRRDLGKNGELKGQKIGSEDISKKYNDLESHLKAARTMEQRLLQVIKDGKGEIKQLLEVEKELGEWRNKIEGMEGELRYQSNLVGFSTLTVTLSERSIRTAAEVVQTERVQAGIEVDDVVKARDEVMTAITTAKGRVTKSELKQHSEGQFNASLNFEVTPESAGPLRDRLKQVGRVARLEIDFLQRAEGGSDPSPTAKVKRGDTQFLVQIYNLTNVAARETNTLQLAATDVNASYRTLQNAVAKANGRILTARLDEQDRRNVKGQLDFEVRRSEEDAIAAALTATGDLLSRNVLRSEASENVTDTKVLYKVSLASAASIPARETTTLAIEVDDVTAATGVFAAQVSEAKGRVVEASEARERNGKITAKLVYDVPLTAESALVEKFKSAGVVRVQQVARNAQASDGPLAVARIEVTLANGELLVPADDGLWAKTRKGLSLSLTVLLWSVSWLVVGLCVVLPWALIAYGGYRIVRRLRPATPPVTTTPT